MGVLNNRNLFPQFHEPSRLVVGHFLTESSHGRERDCEQETAPWCLSYKDIHFIRLGPILMTSFNLKYLLRVLSPNTVTLKARASTYEGIHFRPKHIIWFHLHNIFKNKQLEMENRLMIARSYRCRSFRYDYRGSMKKILVMMEQFYILKWWCVQEPTHIIKSHRTMYTYCTNINFLIFILYYSYINYKQRWKVGEDTQGLSVLFLHLPVYP